MCVVLLKTCSMIFLSIMLLKICKMFFVFSDLAIGGTVSTETTGAPTATATATDMTTVATGAPRATGAPMAIGALRATDCVVGIALPTTAVADFSARL